MGGSCWVCFFCGGLVVVVFLVGCFFFVVVFVFVVGVWFFA